MFASQKPCQIATFPRSYVPGKINCIESDYKRSKPTDSMFHESQYALHLVSLIQKLKRVGQGRKGVSSKSRY